MKLSLLIIAFILSFSPGFGQKFYIPDDSFRACMITLYPGAFDTNDSLITTNAQGFSGNLECESMGIENLSGLEYFNQITILQLDDNIFTSFPDLTGFDNLNFISISDNKNITEIPDLRNLSNLNRLDVYNDNIDSLPSFLGMNNLHILTLGLNPLRYFPNVPPSIRTLAMNRTKFDSLPTLSLYPDLSGLYVKYVGLKELPELNTLTFNTLSIGYNYLSFEDLLPVVNSQNVEALLPTELEMLPFTLEGDSSIVEKATLTLTFPGDENITSNNYIWYHNNVEYIQTTSRTLTIADADFNLSGSWKVEVYNDHPYFDTINYKLETIEKSISVTPCFDGSVVKVKAKSVYCPEGATLTLDETLINNFSPPLTITLDGYTGHTTYFNTTLTGVQEDNYKVTIKDANGCTFESPELLKVTTSCDNVFTPNGDGRNDFFKYNLHGTVKIYSAEDQYINTLVNASHWDGKDQNGTIVKTGYYVLIDEHGNTVFVTVAH